MGQVLKMDFHTGFGDDHLQLVLVRKEEGEHILSPYSQQNGQEVFSFLGCAGLQVLSGNPFHQISTLRLEGPFVGYQMLIYPKFIGGVET